MKKELKETCKNLSDSMFWDEIHNQNNVPGCEVMKFIRLLKEEINNIQKINLENSYKSGVSEPLRKQIMEIIIGSFMELEDKINKLAGENLI